MKYDSIIIGAGVFGLSIADSLIKSGKKVLVLEKNTEIAQGASKGYARMSKLDPRNKIFNSFISDSQKIITEELEKEPGNIMQPVLCFDACEQEHPLRKLYSGLIETNPTADPKTRFGVEPEDKKEIYGYKEQTYTINPDALINSLAESIISNGGKIVKNAKVTRWEKTENKVLVTTEEGDKYQTENLFIAAHGWSVDLINKGNIKVHSVITDSIYTQRAPVWNFPWPKDMPLSIGRSSLEGKTYLDVYFLPEYIPDFGWTMKVGINSDHDRSKVYSSPDEIYHSSDPSTAKITEKETASAKSLMLEKFGIKLDKPLAKDLCCMTYTKQTKEQEFSSMLLGPLVDTNGKNIDGINAAFGGCGLLVKLSPAIGQIAKIGIERNWEGNPIFESFLPSRYIEESKQEDKHVSTIFTQTECTKTELPKILSKL